MTDSWISDADSAFSFKTDQNTVISQKIYLSSDYFSLKITFRFVKFLFHQNNIIFIYTSFQKSITLYYL